MSPMTNTIPPSKSLEHYECMDVEVSKQNQFEGIML